MGWGCWRGFSGAAAPGRALGGRGGALAVPMPGGIGAGATSESQAGAQGVCGVLLGEGWRWGGG